MIVFVVLFFLAIAYLVDRHERRSGTRYESIYQTDIDRLLAKHRVHLAELKTIRRQIATRGRTKVETQ